MLILLVAIVAESFGMFFYVRTKRAITALMALRRRREAPRMAMPEPLIYGAAALALLMAFYDAFVLLFNVLSLPFVISARPDVPGNFVVAGALLAITAVACYLIVKDFLDREKKINPTYRDLPAPG